MGQAQGLTDLPAAYTLGFEIHELQGGYVHWVALAHEIHEFQGGSSPGTHRFAGVLGWIRNVLCTFVCPELAQHLQDPGLAVSTPHRSAVQAPQHKGREGKGREGKGREGKGREGKGREHLSASIQREAKYYKPSIFILLD